MAGISQWTLFQETSLSFLKSLKNHLSYVEEVLMRVSWKEWAQMRKQLPQNFGLFGIIWTTVVHNPSSSQWHFDPKDFGLVALLYFGEFSGGELKVGYPASKTISVQNFDLVLLKVPKFITNPIHFREKELI